MVGNDPAERFAERFNCGCSYEQGQWFVCGRHRAMDPTEAFLDLLSASQDDRPATQRLRDRLGQGRS